MDDEGFDSYHVCMYYKSCSELNETIEEMRAKSQSMGLTFEFKAWGNACAMIIECGVYPIFAQQG